MILFELQHDLNHAILMVLLQLSSDI